jgi:hypothetical protein
LVGMGDLSGWAINELFALKFVQISWKRPPEHFSFFHSKWKRVKVVELRLETLCSSTGRNSVTPQTEAVGRPVGALAPYCRVFH